MRRAVLPFALGVVMLLRMMLLVMMVVMVILMKPRGKAPWLTGEARVVSASLLGTREARLFPFGAGSGWI